MKKLLLTIAIALMFLMTACGGKDPAPAPATEEPAPVTQEPAPATEEPAPAEDADEDTADDDASAEGGFVIDMDYISSKVDVAFVGMGEDGSTLYYAGAMDDSYAMMVFLSPDQTEHMSFIGPASVTNDLMTIEDEANGLTLTFGIELQEDGSLIVDLGDLGTVPAAPHDLNETLEMATTVLANTTPIA